MASLNFPRSWTWSEGSDQVSGGGPEWLLSSRDWDETIPAGGHLHLKFLVDYTETRQADWISLHFSIFPEKF